MPNPYQLAFLEAFEDELEKIAATNPAGAKNLLSKHKGAIGTAVAGAVGYESLRRANEDRKMGRMIRRQQNQGF